MISCHFGVAYPLMSNIMSESAEHRCVADNDNSYDLKNKNK